MSQTRHNLSCRGINSLYPSPNVRAIDKWPNTHALEPISQTRGAVDMRPASSTTCPVGRVQSRLLQCGWLFIGALMVAGAACTDAPPTGTRAMPLSRPLTDVLPPPDSTVTLGFSNPHATWDSSFFESFPDTALIQITFSGLDTARRYDGLVSVYGPLGDIRGGRDGLRVTRPNGTVAIYQPFAHLPTPDTLKATWVDSAIVAGTALANRSPSAGDGNQCLLGNLPVPCYTYTGKQTYTIHYIRVGLVVSSSPDTVSRPGVAAVVSATPTYRFNGQTVPYSMSDWRWVPRGLVGRTLPCPGTVTSCWSNIWETGTMYADAVVNGFSETDSTEIHAYCPSGDSVLDNSPAREAILELLGQEWRNADPNDSVKANRREQAGWVYQDPTTGRMVPWMNPTGGTDACDSWPGTGPAGLPGSAFTYFVHVHPFGKNEQLPSTKCPGRENGTYDPSPSPHDRSFLRQEVHDNGVPTSAQGIIMDKNNIMRFPLKGKFVPIPRYNSAAGCQVI